MMDPVKHKMDLATEQKVVATVLQLRHYKIKDRRYGPYRILVPAWFEGYLERQYLPEAIGRKKTLRQRLLELEGVKEIVVAGELLAVEEL